MLSPATRHAYAPKELFSDSDQEDETKLKKRRSFADFFKLKKSSTAVTTSSSRSSLSSSRSEEEASTSLSRNNSSPVLSKITEIESPKVQVRSEKVMVAGGDNLGFNPTFESGPTGGIGSAGNAVVD